MIAELETTTTAAVVTIGTGDPRRALEVQALGRIRAELEAELGPGWGAAQLEAGQLLADVCNALGFNGREQRAALGARYDGR